MALDTKIRAQSFRNPFGTMTPYRDFEIAHSQNSRNVKLSFTTTSSPRHGYILDAELQRYTSGKWQTIGTRHGWATEVSPFHRDFTNVGVKGASMRFKIMVKGGYLQEGESKLVHSGAGRFFYTMPFVR